jgi:hypothetical protein
MRHACGDVNDVSFGEGHRLAVLNTASLRFAIAVGLRIYDAAAGNQLRLSPGNKENVVKVCVYFSAAARNSYGKLDCMRFVIAKRGSTAARSFSRLQERPQLRCHRLV